MGPSVMYPSTVYSPESHQSAIYRPAGHSPPPPPPPPPSSQQYSGDDKNADLPPPYSVATTSSDDSVATAGVYPPSKLYNLRLDDAPSQPDPRPSSSDY
ncbi:uncharacterized protein LOC134184547 [Corticium candelabrum]|uniref:uncharacterized protein LOC134184547 n=1 Tax=Corticium candelabrum TaxID=121492 RepID=UPI002E34ABD3|nr:uncharacterized protein LOC134184547 [Corticium candelabrum]